MQTDKKILFTDLDGTLLDDNKNITPGNQAAIDAALDAGHTIVISTGRSLPSVIAQARRLGLIRSGCYAIAYNGAQIYDLCHDCTVFGKAIPRRYVRALFDAAAQRGTHIQTYDAVYVLSEQDNDDLRQYAATVQVPYLVVGDIDSALTEDPYKLLAISYSEPAKLLRYQSEVLSEYRGILDSFFSNDNLLEIVPAGVSKGFAVRWMCDHMNIPLENSVAAGDAQNDISMLEAAHVGAVMCNAFPGIAEHGTYVTQADNNHDGVAEIIRKFILCDS